MVKDRYSMIKANLINIYLTSPALQKGLEVKLQPEEVDHAQENISSVLNQNRPPNQINWGEKNIHTPQKLNDGKQQIMLIDNFQHQWS